MKTESCEQRGLYIYERKAFSNGFGAVCGIDEAGRGPLAGPVFAAAVILPLGLDIPGLDDSKKISAQNRETLFELIKKQALAYAVASADEKEIDSLNILNATFLAMNRAFKALDITADAALVDGNRDPGLPVGTTLIVKGDSHSASIAAASIMAKVSRDRYMAELDKQYPQYQFARHKGYPTKLHYQLLSVYGPCGVHRMSFLNKFYKNQELSSGIGAAASVSQ